MQPEPRSSSLGRWSGVLLLAFASFLYLQFGLQAMAAAPSQAVLVLIGAVALGFASVRFSRHERLAHIVFLGTLPLLLFSVVVTFVYSDESPVFAIIFAVAPALSGLVWLWRRRDLGCA